MVIFGVRVPRGMKAPKRTVDKAMKSAGLAMMQHWIDNYLPLHFKTIAYTRYPGTYKRRHEPKGEPTRGQHDPAPLKESGMAEMEARLSARAHGTSSKVSASFTVPMHVLRLKAQGYDPEAELSVVNAEETRQMLKVFEGVYAAELQRLLDEG